MTINMQVRAVCYELGISERDAQVYRRIDQATERGNEGIGVFAVLDLVDTQTREKLLAQRFAQVDSIVGRLTERAPSDPVARELVRSAREQRDDAKRLFTDPDYRQQMWSTYTDHILPRVHEMGDDMGLGTVVKYALDEDLDKVDVQIIAGLMEGLEPTVRSMLKTITKGPETKY